MEAVNNNNWKGGRPRKAESEKRRYTIPIRLNLAEFETLSQEASMQKLAKSDFLYQRLIQKKVVFVQRIQTHPDTKNALDKIGVNLNQIARKINSWDGREDLKIYLDELAKINELIKAYHNLDVER